MERGKRMKREINNEEERRRKEDDGEENIPVHAIPAELFLVEFMFSPFIFHWIILIVSARDDAETEAQHFLQLSFRFYGLCQVLLITSPLNRSLTVRYFYISPFGTDSVSHTGNFSWLFTVSFFFFIVT